MDKLRLSFFRKTLLNSRAAYINKTMCVLFDCFYTFDCQIYNLRRSDIDFREKRYFSGHSQGLTVPNESRVVRGR